MNDKHPNLSRRAFLSLSALALSAVGSGCSSAQESEATGDGSSQPETKPVRTLQDIYDTRVVNVGIRSDYEPFAYINANGQYTGFDQYFCQFLAYTLGSTANYIPVDSKSCYDKIGTHDVDVCVAQMSPNDMRAGEVDFTLPLYKLQLGVVSPAAAVVDTVEQLKQGELIVCEGSYAQQYAMDTWPKVTLRPYDTMTDAYGALEAGKGIALITDEIAAECWVRKNDAYVLSMRGIGEPRIIAAAIAPGNDEFLKRCNKSVREYILNYEVNKAYDKHLDPTVGPDYRIMFIERASVESVE